MTETPPQLPILGPLPPDWRIVQLGACLDGGTRNGVYKPKGFHGDGCKIVNMGELFANRRLFDIRMRRVRLSPVEIARFGLERGDLLFARRSLVAEGAGKCSIVCEVNEPTVFESSIIRVRPRQDVTDSLFLFYVFESPYGSYVLDTIRRHVAVAGITGEDLKSLFIPLPPLSEQQSIANVLGVLDDKIELNRKVNHALQRMAAAIFTAWFVDFEPVRAKAKGGTAFPGMPPDVFLTLPQTFDETVMGPVPKGWRWSCLQDVLAVLETGSRPRGGVGDIHIGVPSIGAESIVTLGHFDYSKTKYVPREFYERMQRGHVVSRDVLLYKDGGRPGEFEPHVSMFGDGFPFEECCINEHVFRTRTTPPLSQLFLYFWLSCPMALEEMRVRGTGVAIPGISSQVVRELRVLIPTEPVLRAFDEVVEPMVASVFLNCRQELMLATMRDYLAPKLLAGELRTVEAEAGVVGL